jgi:hypothetical protein
MTAEEVIARLRSTRGSFDEIVAGIPSENLDRVPEGHAHSPKQIVAHVNAYEQLIVERLKAARAGETTAFDRDRQGWEAFNERIWQESESAHALDIIAASAQIFAELLSEVSRLTETDLGSSDGIAKYIDPTWLRGRNVGELIAIDAYEHYPMHFESLEASRRI